MLRRSATRFIKEQIPDRSKLGIVAFSTKPRILKNLTEVHQNNRRELALGLPFKDDGGNTGIGPALTLAMQVSKKLKDLPQERRQGGALATQAPYKVHICGPLFSCTH